jgi:hypothetical protein
MTTDSQIGVVAPVLPLMKRNRQIKNEASKDQVLLEPPVLQEWGTPNWE